MSEFIKFRPQKKAPKPLASAIAQAGLGFDPANGDSIDAVCAGRPLSDIGNAERLVMRFGDVLAFIPEIGFVVWDGKRWDDAQGGVRAHGLSQECARLMVKEVEYVAERIADPELLDACLEHAAASGNSGRVRNSLKECQTMLTRAASDFDARPYLFNAQNGTIELSIRPKLRPFDKADMITRIAGAAYDPDAKAPVFEEFLEKILPDDDVRLFALRWFGYGLTGDTSEQAVVFLYGTGSNGKSTLLTAIAKAVGDYVLTIPIESVLADERRSGSGPTPDLAQLPGRRLVTASEPEQRSRLSESRIKAITGGEELAVRHLNKNFFRFRPQFHLTISCNHKPVVTGADDGIWRRLIIVPFREKIGKEDAKPVHDALEAEAAGILNLMVGGCQDYFARGGLAIPDAVRAETESFRAESNPIRAFRAECLQEVPGHEVRAGRIYEVYCRWSKANMLEPKSLQAFGRRMKETGLKTIRSGHVKYLDVQLTPYATDNYGQSADESTQP